MGASAQTAQVYQYRNQKPQKIDAGGGQVIIHFPGIDERRQRQKKKTQQRHHEIAMISALQVVRVEPHQGQRDARKQQDD